LELALEFICPFIIGECAFLGDEVENLLVVGVVADVPSNQFRISYHAADLWPALKEKIPLVLNLAVH
jgi:hypothetical protein